MIKPWIFEFFANPGGPDGDPAPSVVADHFKRHLDLWASAEPLGFEGIFFSEHHFGPAFSPSPNLLIANLATRTRSMRLGVMGMVMPYYEPWRVFEEIAMLDHLTGGRLEIGTATGIPQEMAKVGMPFEEATARSLEALEILDAALSQPVISHHGRYWNFDHLHLVPRPLQQPAPPKWTTVISEESARRSARRGAKICTGFHPLERVRAIFDAYREEAARCGESAGPQHLALRRNVSIDTDGGLALAKSDVRKRASRAGLTADPRVRLNDTPDAPHTFSVGDDEFIAGNPQEVAAQIVEQCRYAGAGHFLAIFDRHEPPQRIAQVYELFGREVIPVLRASVI
jgi:alkanesulfonate monooxygenase SsuD/methylene tetrahydromethanopterin reductase-like flavin-dependent oxidoreductase (luciferase family)